jgi:hypothetical protein
MSEEFEEFLASFCNIDANPAETASLMHADLGEYVGPWLRPELDAAIRDGSLSPELAMHLTSRDFTSPEQVRDWLSGLRQSWFGGTTGQGEEPDRPTRWLI